MRIRMVCFPIIKSMIDIFNTGLVIDVTFLANIGSKPFYEILWIMFSGGGWIIFIPVFFWGFFKMFVVSRQAKFAAKQNYVYLALDIPKVNMQSPKAIENVFSTLAGAHSTFNWEEEIFEGAFQLGFSLEIISIDGYIQYIVRTPVHWRHMVESAFYAQYPDAEITEVEDYAAAMQLRFPNDEYKLWGTDLVLYNDEYFPIRTYPEFEHQMSKDYFKDPMAALLEVMNKLREGEQFWFQLMVYPTDTSWTKAGINALKELVGQPVKKKSSFLGSVLEEPMKWVYEFGNQLIGQGFAEGSVEEAKSQMAWLPPLEKIKAEGIVRKLSKIGFYCKPRIIYLGKREVFNKGLGVSGTFGAIKQFSDLHLNGFKPDKNRTQARWPWFKVSRLSNRQNRIFNAYVNRDPSTGTPPKILNLEELATLYHFPVFETRGPFVKSIDSKKSFAPVGLPLEESRGADAGPIGLPLEPEESKDTRSSAAPIDFDDDYFEKRFAKDKTMESDHKRKKEIIDKLKKQRELKSDEVGIAPEVTAKSGPSNPSDRPPSNIPFVE